MRREELEQEYMDSYRKTEGCFTGFIYMMLLIMAVIMIIVIITKQ